METITIVYANVECPNCGVIFGVNCGLDKKRREDNKAFYCPNGHSMSYTESTADRLARELEFKERRIADKNGYIATLERKVAKLEKGAKKKAR